MQICDCPLHTGLPHCLSLSLSYFILFFISFFILLLLLIFFLFCFSSLMIKIFPLLLSGIGSLKPSLFWAINGNIKETIFIYSSTFRSRNWEKGVFLCLQPTTVTIAQSPCKHITSLSFFKKLAYFTNRTTKGLIDPALRSDDVLYRWTTS